MNGLALGSGIISPAGVVQTVAVFGGAAALGVAGFLYTAHRTRVLRSYLVFLTTLFLFVLSFWFREIGFAIATIASDAGDSTGRAAGFIRSLAGASFLCEAIAGVVLVLVLPSLTHAVFNRSVSSLRRSVTVLSALAMSGLALTTIALPVRWAPIALASIMYVTIAASIVEMAVWATFAGKGPSSSGRLSQSAFVGTLRAIRAFLVVSALFLPFFVLDIVISAPGVAAWAQHRIVRLLDNLSVPLYFLILVTGSVRFAYRFLNEPALMAEERVTVYARERFNLTEREAEVVEYIVEGFSVSDTATAMKISPKTVENHIYSVYQKTEVTNRIQLYNLFDNRRRIT